MDRSMKWINNQLEFEGGYALISNEWFEIWIDTPNGPARRVRLGQCSSRREAKRQVEQYLMENKV